MDREVRAEQVERRHEHTDMRLDAGEDDPAGAQALQAHARLLGRPAREHDLGHGPDVGGERVAQLLQGMTEALGILLGHDDGQLESLGRGHQDLDVAHDLFAVVGVHGGEEPLLHVHEQERGAFARQRHRVRSAHEDLLGDGSETSVQAPALQRLGHVLRRYPLTPDRSAIVRATLLTPARTSRALPSRAAWQIARTRRAAPEG